MKISYNNSIKDLVDFKLSILKKDSYIKRILLILRFIIIIIFSFICYLIYSSDLEIIYQKLFIISTVIIGIISIKFYPQYYYWRINKRLSKRLSLNKNILDTKIVELNELNVIKSISDEKYIYPWSNMQSVVNTPTHIYFYINTSNEIVIPLSAFSNESEKDNFLNFINKYIKIKNEDIK